MKLIIIGPPGSGKGSQAELLENKLNLKHIPLGEILRDEIRKNTTIGKKVKRISKGSLAPDYVVDKLVKKIIKGKNNLILKRLSNRRVCKCGETYNLLTKKPKKDSTCDKDGKKLYQRDDDTPKIIKKRIKLYKKQTIPVINYYKKKKLLI